LAPLLENQAALDEAFDSLKRAPRQEAILMVLAEAWLRRKLPAERAVLEEAQASAAALAALVQKGFAERIHLPVSRLREVQHSRYQPPAGPTPAQAQALQQITESWTAYPARPVLLHGVTGSGKTYVYTELAQQVVSQGKQVLLLLPEIALTTQVVERLRAAFGELLGVYHSRFSEAERVEIWQRVRDGGYRVVVGVRSAVWLPFDQLGLVIVDEEHDPSLRQQDTAPRFHARDMALYIGQQLQIPVVLGSATPSLESWSQAEQGRYTRVSLLHKAVAGSAPPRVEMVDMRREVQHRLSHGRLSSRLMEALAATLARGEQGIVFVHRKGYAPFLNCTTCGTVPMCPHCDVALTHHKMLRQLRCHICGYTQPEPHACEACGQPTFQEVDYGTERVEELLRELYPKARIARMDADTTRGKTAHARLIQDFEAGEIDLLVGTQMVTKGLDFPNLTLTAVVNADAILAYPDFRAQERAFQIFVQLMGRLGRAGKSGTFFVQTFRPDHPLFGLLQAPFARFYDWEVAQRQSLGYPPFTRVVQLTLQHRDRPAVEQHARLLTQQLQAQLGSYVRGPAVPVVERVRNRYRRQILVFIPRTASPAAAKARILQVLKDHPALLPLDGLRVTVEVDV
ncbi:MAG: primosomal protein N', partial [Bacteroidetes bacterium]|nr:primosomal protein N' [Bacteroidota bacterium]